MKCAYHHAVRWTKHLTLSVTVSILWGCAAEDAPRLLVACEGTACGADGNRYRGTGLGVWTYRNASNRSQVLPIALEGLYRNQVLVSLTNTTDDEVAMPESLRGVVIDVAPEDSPDSIPPPVAIPYDPDRPGRRGGPHAGSNMELPNPDTALISQGHPVSLAKTLVAKQRVVVQKNDVSGMYERDLRVPVGVQVDVYVR